MKISKIMLTILVVCAVGMLSVGCGSDADTESETQVVAVQRGDVTIDVTAVGNLAYSQREELSFKADGTVGEVLVEVGDSVEEGQTLAQLNDASIALLRRAVLEAELDFEEARTPYTDSDIAQAEVAVANAQLALESALEALEQAENPYSESEIAQAELAIINAKIALEAAENNFERAEEQYYKNTSVTAWAQDFELKQAQLTIAEFNLAEAEETLAEMQAGADPLEVAWREKELALAQANLESAEDELAEIQVWTEGAVYSQEAEIKQLEITSAWAALDEARDKLDTATLAAPFNGIITAVDIEAGDAVKADQMVIELVDPDKFKVDILVNETDILNMSKGATATIQVDAISGISFPAEVIYISPTAVIQSGVVNYKVTVELQPLDSLTVGPESFVPSEGTERPQIDQEAMEERLQSAIESGLMTQEQADAMREHMAEGGSFSQEQTGQRPGAAILESIQLREGLSITISVIVQESSDVLIVPNNAIIYEGMATYVQALEDDVTEQRQVQVGISDWQYTEITEGLTEGEMVVVPEGTTTTTTTTQQGGQGGIMIPGMGGFGR